VQGLQQKQNELQAGEGLHGILSFNARRPGEAESEMLRFEIGTAVPNQ